MKLKKILAVLLTLSMLFSIAASASPKYVFTDGNAWEIGNLTNSAYRTAMNTAIEAASNVYIGDDTGKTALLAHLLGTGTYDERLAAAAQSANLVGSVNLVNLDLTSGAAVTVPGTTTPAPVAVTVKSVEAQADINVANGTTLAAISLPTFVTLNLSDNSTEQVAATWNAPSNFDGTRAGVYEFTASYNLPTTVTGTKPVATLNVIVAMASYVKITNATALQATELVANGQTTMTIVAKYTRPNVTGFTGAAELVSKKGLKPVQTENIFESDGTVTFNVKLPTLTEDYVDTLSVRIIASSENNKYVGDASEPLTLTYKAYTPGTGGADTDTTSTVSYKIDSVKSADMADRVNVYMSNVEVKDLEKVKLALVDQLKLGWTETDLVNEPMAISVIDTAKVIGVPTTKADYVFSALLNTPVDFLADNQKNYYDVAATTNTDAHKVIIAPATGSFILVDDTKPRMTRANAIDATATSGPGIEIAFSEPVNAAPMDWLSVFNPNNWTVNGHILSTPTDGTIYLVPGNDRNVVQIRFTNSAVQKYLNNGQNLIQARSISDWAGWTDMTDNNRITTQDLTFMFTKPTITTGLKITPQSPEQFLVSLSSPIYNDEDATSEIDLAAALETASVITLETKDVDGTVIRTLDASEYTVTSLTTPEAGQSASALVELNADWTKLLTTPVGTTYFEKYFKVAVTPAAAIYDVFGAQITTTPTATTIVHQDITSPEVKTFGTPTSVGNVEITMTEPVQLYAVTPAAVDYIDPSITPSEQQENSKDGVPVPTFEYVKTALNTTTAQALAVGDKVDGYIVAHANAEDTVFTVAPKSTLEAGTYTLVVRSISDDVGNTMQTASTQVIIAAKPGTEPTTPGAIAADNTITPYVVWADYIDNQEGNDVVRILFSRQMSIDALRAATFNINGKQVNQDATITSDLKVLYRQNSDDRSDNYNKFYGVNGNHNELRGQIITIILPADFINSANENHAILTLPNSLTDFSGNVLNLGNNGSSNQFEMDFETYHNLVDGDLLPAFEYPNAENLYHESNLNAN